MPDVQNCIVIGDTYYAVWNLPDRKRKLLCKITHGGCQVKPVASFTHDENAAEFVQHMEAIARLLDPTIALCSAGGTDASAE